MFESKYMAAMALAKGGDCSTVGVALADIEPVEARIGPLPKALRDYYSLLGQESHNHLFDDLIASSELQVRDGMITFYTENQGAVSWGILVEDQSLEDPAVYIISEAGRELVGLTVSDFLVWQCYWQSVNGGDYLAQTTPGVDEDVMELVHRDWTQLIRDKYVCFYENGAQILCSLSEGTPRCQLYLSCTDFEALERVIDGELSDAFWEAL